MTGERFTLSRLGQRGEGVAETSRGPVYLPYALPGEIVVAERDGDLAHVTEWVSRRPDRVSPVCRYFGTCGGCAVQALPPAPYADWKRNLVVSALARSGVEAEVAPLVDAHGAGRRRATFHGRQARSPNVLGPATARVGFMRARSHDLVDIAACPVLVPELAPALPIAHRITAATLPLGKPLDILATSTDVGLDVDLRGLGLLETDWLQRLAELGRDLGLARLSNHGVPLIELRTPTLRVGPADVPLPPGGFLQATAAGEEALAALVSEAVGGARRILDLFCGMGTFALRLAARAAVQAFDLEPAAIQALDRAVRSTRGLKPLRAEVRDLFRRPLQAEELADLDAAVLDPPRAGALAQVEHLARSAIPTIVSVSCQPATFARDAAVLLAGGYALTRVVPVDQFRYAPHVEIVGVFRRPKSRHPQRRALFG